MSKLIVIDGYIGQYYFSQQLIRNMLSEAEKGEHIQVDISSLGGQLNHALAIHDMFAEHGNVSSKLYGFIASAATLIALPTKTRLSQNAFYLIHKVLTWVDEWGNMNEDDIEAVIEKLNKQKDEVAKMTLIIAKMYFERAKPKGKSFQEVLALMKEDKWLSADEALEWGFVDEIYKPTPSEKITSAAQTNQIFEMIAAEGLPTPPRQSSKSNPNPSMKKSIVLPQINQVLNITELALDDEQGSFLNEESLMALDVELNARNEAINTLTASVASLQDQNSQQAQTITAQTQQIEQLQNSQADLQQAQQSVSDLTAQNNDLTSQNQTLTSERDNLQNRINQLSEKLKRIPAAAAIIQQSEKDPASASEGPDWNTIDSLPHNQNVD